MPNHKFKLVYLVMGIPQSGKTHFTQQFRKDWTVISADDVKKDLYGNEWPWYANHGTFNEIITRFRKALYSKASYTDRIYIDYNFLSKLSRQQIYKIIEQARRSNSIETRIILIVMDTPLTVCLERNDRREIRVADKVIRRQHKKPLILKRDESPYIRGIFFITKEDYPDIPEWHGHKFHMHFNGCITAVKDCKEGGDETDAVLACRGNDPQPSDCCNPSNSPDNPDIDLVLLVAMGIHQAKTEAYSRFINEVRRSTEVQYLKRLAGIVVQQAWRIKG